jgi:hypothetical protein
MHCANIATKSSSEHTLVMGRLAFGQMLLSAACPDGRAAEFLDDSLILFELW